MTQLGVRVVVATDPVSPRDIAHPTLFMPKRKPAEPGPAAPAAPEVAAGDLVKVADAGAMPAALLSDAAAGQMRKPAEKAVEAPQQAALAETPKLDGPQVNADPAKPELLPAVKPKSMLKGQVAVFISRKDKKLYVRQGFTPLFETPVTIEQPDQPLGTHVFTAMEFTDNGAGMRWNVITMPSEAPRASNGKSSRTRSGRKAPEPAPKLAAAPPAPPAADVLSRINIPQDAVDRIGQLLVPGSSLVITDQGPGNETGRGTDFIVVTRK